VTSTRPQRRPPAPTLGRSMRAMQRPPVRLDRRLLRTPPRRHTGTCVGRIDAYEGRGGPVHLITEFDRKVKDAARRLTDY
jgi:hypothetical protein